MLNPDLRILLKDHISRYSLVTAVAKRARTITEDPVLSEKCGTEKLYPGRFLWYNIPDLVFSGGTL